MSILETITAAVLGNALVLLVLGGLGKSLLEKIIQRDSKTFEIELKAKTDATIEKLKSDLHLRTIEHQITFGKLHEKRAEVIAELNSLLAETLWAAESVLSLLKWAGEPSEQEKYRDAEQKWVDFFRYFDKHRIYLPTEICQKIEKLVLEVRSHVIGVGVYFQWDEKGLPDHTRKEKYEALMKGWDMIKNQVPGIRKELEDEFRVLLGAHL